MIDEKDLNAMFEKLKQEIILMIPEIVVKHIQDQHKYKKLVDNFYKENPELIAERLLVQVLTNKTASEHPELSIEDIFNKVAKQAKETLKNNEKL